MVDRLLSKSHSSISLWPVALLRLYTGIFFAYNGFRKVMNDGFADGMVGFLNHNAENSVGFFRAFTESVVIPNKGLFAGLVAYGELFAGLALIVGLATRYAALAGAVMVLSFWLAKGQGFLAGSNHDAVWFMIFLVLGLIPAGKTFGLDDGLSDRFRFLR